MRPEESLSGKKAAEGAQVSSLKSSKMERVLKASFLVADDKARQEGKNLDNKHRNDANQNASYKFII